MIPYFGTPMTGGNGPIAVAALKGAHGLISFARPEQLGLCVELCQSFVLDNGAYSFWAKGTPVDWEGYYRWVDDTRRYPNFDWAIIPDVIGGTEEENDRLIAAWPKEFHVAQSVPVFHLHENLDRLRRLMVFPRIAIGGSCEYKRVGSPIWWQRIREVFAILCGPDGRPTVKVHGLRMLDPKIVERLPLASADSSSIARNVAIDKAWTGSYRPFTKEGRAAVLRQRTEFFNSPSKFDEWNTFI